MKMFWIYIDGRKLDGSYSTFREAVYLAFEYSERIDAFVAIVDTETGEVLREYAHGYVTYTAQGWD